MLGRLRRIGLSPASSAAAEAIIDPLGTVQSLHTSAAPAGKPTVAVAVVKPDGWPWGENQKANGMHYNSVRKQYRQEVSLLRQKWQTHVRGHEKHRAALKEAADTQRLARQEQEMQRQLARWSPRLDGRSHKPPPAVRQQQYERAALREMLSEESRCAQTEQLLRRSVAWVEPHNVDAAIQHALANPVDLYQDAELWPEVKPGDERPLEWVEDFEGPLGVAPPTATEFVAPDQRKRNKGKARPGVEAPPVGKQARGGLWGAMKTGSTKKGR